MSVAREVTINYDLDVLADAARDAGFFVKRSGGARDYWGNYMKGAEKCDLVVSSPAHKFDMGFVRQADGTTSLFADNHGNHVQRDLADKILPRYAERMIERDRRFKVVGRSETSQKLTLVVGRR